MVGISEALLDRIIGTAYRILNLITFYTVKGADSGGPPSQAMLERPGIAALPSTLAARSGS